MSQGCIRLRVRSPPTRGPSSALRRRPLCRPFGASLGRTTELGGRNSHDLPRSHVLRHAGLSGSRFRSSSTVQRGIQGQHLAAHATLSPLTGRGAGVRGKRFDQVEHFRISTVVWSGVARRQVTFSCLAKRKSPKRRPPRCAAPPKDPGGASLGHRPELGGSKLHHLLRSPTRSNMLASTAPNSVLRPRRHRGGGQCNILPLTRPSGPPSPRRRGEGEAVVLCVG